MAHGPRVASTTRGSVTPVTEIVADGTGAATVAGAVGGAVVGNEIEKRRNDGERYRITVRSRDGRDSVFEQDSLEGIRVGDRVRVDGGRVIRD